MDPPDGDQDEQKTFARTESLVGSLVEISTNDGGPVDDDEGDGISLSSTTSSGDREHPQGRRRQRRKEEDPRSDPKQDGEVHRESTHQLRHQMIESLVRFSYHTPIAVLEDLINHQIQAETKHSKKELELENETSGERTRNDSADESSIGLTSLSSGEYDDRNAGILEGENVTNPKFHSLPPNRTRESALVFIDISGFTKLSTLLDEETLSRVINSYFEKIIGEVRSHGGDVLKFAGDALFVEWRVPEENNAKEKEDLAGAVNNSCNVLKELNCSLASMDTTGDILSTTSGLPLAVLRAARCAAAIVNKYSDHEVVAPHHVSDTAGVLNVHCGIGCGLLVGMHASDYKEDDGLGEEEQAIETRREYLFLGKAIDQVRL